MACRNVWVTIRLNFGTTFLQLLLDFFSYIKILILQTLKKTISHIFQLKVQRIFQSRQIEPQDLCSGNSDQYHFLVSTGQEVSLNGLNTNNNKKNSDCGNPLGIKFEASSLIPNLGVINILQICVSELAEKYTRQLE